MYNLPTHTDPNKIFIINRSELVDRWDGDMVLYNKILHNFKYDIVSLKNLLIKNPQYGANESGIIRTSFLEPRYIRITDIDEYGLLKNEIGVTAQNIESRFILDNDDILFARSGNTVGKAYIHKKDTVNYDCFFAGYMIRFVVDKSKILPDYLFTYTQLGVYKNWVKAIQRTAGQPNINAEEYKSLQIPLPGINIQKDIVSIFQSAYTKKQEKEAKAQQLLNSIDTYLLGELGISLPEKDNSLQNRIFTTSFSEVTGGRLDPDYNSKYDFLINQDANFPFNTLGSLIVKPPQYGANEEAEEYSLENAIRYIRITDIDEIGELKDYGKKTAKNTNNIYELKYNDILFARSGSVGRCYIHKKVEEKAIFAGYLIRFVLNIAKINPDFLFFYCNSKIYKYWVSAIERPAVQSNINSEEYKSLPIPLPPLEKQNEIAQHIQDMRSKAKVLQADAKNVLEQAKQQVEKMIIG
ncbi:restriction endonuclease subunit S [Flavobacterium sp. WV_118_3]|uniref:restriction endonuclease subunit S n=1 Tax=Flavobacterium sp. WV_118_3 TaxID=3151764 RepID=UPI00321B30AD